MKTPTKNIYWRDIKGTDLVEETENLFIVRFKGRGKRPAVAYWMGQEAREAQTKLKAMVEKSKLQRMTSKQRVLRLLDKWTRKPKPVSEKA